MAIDWAVWGPPLAVLGVGVSFAVWTVTRMRTGSDEPAISAESRRIDLQSTRDEVLEALRHLEFEKDKLPPADYAREREALIARGSRAMEALENPDMLPARGGPVLPPPVTAPSTTAATPPAAPATGWAGLAPEWKGALYAIGIVLILAVLWNMASQNSRDRGDGSMTGGESITPNSSPGPQAQIRENPKFKEDVAALEAKIAANPSDVVALNGLTHLWLLAGDPQQAFQYNDQVLKVDENDIEGRTNRGVLTVMMGMADKGIAILDEVLVEKPDHSNAIVYRGLLLFQLGRVPEALESLRVAAEAHPTDPEITGAYQQVKQAAGQAGGAPGSAPPAAGGEMFVSGTLMMDAAAQATLKGTERLFISISDPARPGPPVAATKINPPHNFPMAFQLTSADIQAMPGSGAVSDTLDLKVRIDLDGNAMTKEPGAPFGTIMGLRKGSTGVVVTLGADGGSSSAGTPGAPAPAGDPLLSPLPGGAAPAPSGPVEMLASGTADLDPELKSLLTGTEVVFVSLRDPAGGPPIAAAKVPAKFPLQFQVTTADVVQMGGARPIPATFNVSVRIDRDGNAMTKEGEPEALAPGVTKGVSQLQLMLQ